MYITEENTLGGTLYAAISAIDIALWDIVGKRLNAPVYKLIGGNVHDEIRIYTSDRWGNIPRTADAYRQRTKELIAQGATAGKYDPFGSYPGPERQLSTAVLNEVREMVRGIREAGPNFDICIEAHGKFNMASAGRIVKMLEPFDPFFLEEPVPPENVEAMASHYVTFAPHNPNGPICTAASLHIAASSPNFLIMEEGSTRTELYNDIFQDGWKATLGSWQVPESPGLGIDFSPQFLKEYSMKQ